MWLTACVLTPLASPQAVFVSPHRFLPAEPEAPTRFLETQVLYAADTNVRPLLRKARLADFDAARSYLTGAAACEARLRWDCWELRYGYGQADLFEGDAGAARLFLEAEQKRLRPDTSYPVNATLNRSAIHRWMLAYHGETVLSDARVRYQIGLSYYRLQRVQQGWLQGQKQSDSFAGALTLLTTRGVPAAQIGGDGYALSAGLTLAAEGWSASVFVDNLWSQLRVRKLQRVEATVRVNQLTPDADGFLRAPPFLEGRVSEIALRRVARPQVELALWRRERTRRYGLIAAQHDRWQAALTFGWEIGDGALWAAYWQPRPMLWIGYAGRHWRLMLGADTFQRDTLRRLYAEVRWRVPIQ
ncbi:MAG: hypothetical protein NZ874_00405 [Fimbriimonadales bacterium]|nr:hypothetical protein [Fimbriimonadales bacterium]